MEPTLNVVFALLFHPYVSPCNPVHVINCFNKKGLRGNVIHTPAYIFMSDVHFELGHAPLTRDRKTENKSQLCGELYLILPEIQALHTVSGSHPEFNEL